MRNIYKLICFIGLIIFSCKEKETPEPMKNLPVKNCCDSITEKDSTSFAISNTGADAKTFRLYGGGTGLDSVVDNSFTLGSLFIPAGDQPQFLTYNPDLNYVYVVNTADGTVSVINSSNNNIATINAGLTVGAGQSDPIYVSANKYFYYSGNNAGTQIAAINTLDNSSSLITVGNDPFGLSYATGFNKLYVCNGGDGTVSVINTLTNTVSGLITVGSGPGRSIYISSSQSVYVLNETDQTISVIDANTDTVVATIPVGSYPVWASYLSSVDRIYISNVIDGTVSVINPQTNTVVSTITVGNLAAISTVNEVDKLVYCNNEGDYTVSVIDGLLNTVVDVITLSGSNPGNGQYIAFNTFDKYLYVVMTGDNEVDVFDTQSNNAFVETISTGPGSSPVVALFNNSNSIYISCRSIDEVMTITSSNQVDITPNGGESTVYSINQGSLSEPICICSMKITTDNKSTFNTPMQKKLKNSTGTIESEEINLLSRYNANFSLNTVVVDGKDLKTCVLDGFNYLEWSIPSGENINILITYCQYDRTSGLRIGKPVTIKKKYTHGHFKL